GRRYARALAGFRSGLGRCRSEDSARGPIVGPPVTDRALCRGLFVPGLTRRRDEAGFVGEDDGLGAVAEAEFGQDAASVGRGVVVACSAMIRVLLISVLDRPWAISRRSPTLPARLRRADT